MPFVLHNSVVSGWILDGQTTDYSKAVAQRLHTDRAIAPPLLLLEYTNLLRTACKRQRMVATQAQESLKILASLPIDIDPGKPEPSQLLDLALRYELTSYDATYLDLALRRRLPIATQDQALAKAARVAGAGVIAA